MSRKIEERPVYTITQNNCRLVRIERLKESPFNARQHSDIQIDQLAESIQKFGMVTAIIVDRNHEVVAGHGRLAAARKAGLKHVPVIMLDHLSDAEIRAYRILDNRLAEHSNWDESRLALEFEFLVMAELSAEIDFSPEITGFTTPEIDIFLEADREDQADTNCQLENVAVDASKPPVTRAGDIWTLGRHVIMCGDARDPDVHRQLLGNAHIQLVVSDPPYNVPIKGFVSGKGAVVHDNFAEACGEMSSMQFENFLHDFLSNASASLEEGGCLYVFMDWRHDQELQAAARRCGLVQLNLCIWDKGTGGMGSFYKSRHELVFVYRKGATSHRNNIQLGKFGRNRTNVWTAYPSANMSRQGRKALKLHPTPKPVAMIADIIRDVTRVNDVVFDAFLGGGTTVIAAEKTNRRCYGLEIDPRYIDATIRRWQELTGQDAIHAGSGMTFSCREEGFSGKKAQVIRERSRRVV